MQSAIATCNVALTTYVGTRTITSFDESLVEAEQCKLHYDRIRRSLLERWPWVFAARRESLVAETIDNRAGAWSYRYARPGHVIADRWVNDMTTARQAMPLGQTPDSPREMTADSIYSDVPCAAINTPVTRLIRRCFRRASPMRWPPIWRLPLPCRSGAMRPLAAPRGKRAR